MEPFIFNGTSQLLAWWHSTTMSCSWHYNLLSLNSSVLSHLSWCNSFSFSLSNLRLTRKARLLTSIFLSSSCKSLLDNTLRHDDLAWLTNLNIQCCFISRWYISPLLFSLNHFLLVRGHTPINRSFSTKITFFIPSGFQSMHVWGSWYIKVIQEGA
jgi:hypothetical protein